MSAHDDGGPAFPCEGFRTNSGENVPVDGISGITLRDYFAAKVAPALLELCQHDSHDGKSYIRYIAELSYGMADAMLKARQQ